MCRRYPNQVQDWNAQSNNLVVLRVDTEADLLDWADRLHQGGIEHTLFTEPDLGGQVTAIGVVPTTTRMLTGLPLAG